LSDGKRIIAPDEQLEPAVRKLFERYATGRYSLKEVAKFARADGLVYPKTGSPVPTSTFHKILRKRAYCGEYDYNGVTYVGKYKGIISKELWQKVQDLLDGRHLKRPKKRIHDFAFSGLITCGHCGCALVGEIKKGRYIYYHCTGYKGKCPAPHTRDEVVEQAFTNLLRDLTFSSEILEWVTRSLRDSHEDESAFRGEAIAKLQREHRRIQDRIDAMYMGKLDGRIDNDFFDRKAAEFGSEQSHLMGDIQAYQCANRCYAEDGIRMLELAWRNATGAIYGCRKGSPFAREDAGVLATPPRIFANCSSASAANRRQGRTGKEC
jgi:hypothetical protein